MRLDQVRQHEGRRKGQRLEYPPALPQGLRQKTLPVEIKQIEGHEDHRDLAQKRGVDLFAAEPALQLKERSHHSVAECEQLTVQQKVVGDGQGCLDHLREGRGDLVEVARVEHHAVAFLVQLATDPVVFVFHPGFPANPAHDGGRVLFRGGQHELEWVHQP